MQLLLNRSEDRDVLAFILQRFSLSLLSDKSLNMKHSRLDAILCEVLKKTFLSGGCRVMTQAEADERPLGLN